MNPLHRLRAEYETWLIAQRLPHLPPADLIQAAITPEQRGWLSHFILRWELTEDALDE